MNMKKLVVDKTLEKTCCAYCKRTAQDVSNFNGVSHTHRVEIMYADSQKRPVCGRCVSEHDVPISFGGEAVIGRTGSSWSTYEYAHSQLVLDVVLTDEEMGDPALRFSEVDFQL